MKRKQARSSCKLTGVVTTLILALLRAELEQQGALGQIVHRGGQGNRTLREKAARAGPRAWLPTDPDDWGTWKPWPTAQP